MVRLIQKKKKRNEKKQNKLTSAVGSDTSEKQLSFAKAATIHTYLRLCYQQKKKKKKCQVVKRLWIITFSFFFLVWVC